MMPIDRTLVAALDANGFSYQWSSPNANLYTKRIGKDHLALISDGAYGPALSWARSADISPTSGSVGNGSCFLTVHVLLNQKTGEAEAEAMYESPVTDPRHLKNALKVVTEMVEEVEDTA